MLTSTCNWMYERLSLQTYLPAFEACVREGNGGSIMCSYNAVNGVPSCANSFLQNTIVREQWGFEGYIVSDRNVAKFLWISYTDRSVTVGLSIVFKTLISENVHVPVFLQNCSVFIDTHLLLRTRLQLDCLVVVTLIVVLTTKHMLRYILAFLSMQ